MDGLDMEVTMTDDVVLDTGLVPDSLVTSSIWEGEEKHDFRSRDLDSALGCEEVRDEGLKEED